MKTRADGFTYLGLLILIAVWSISLCVTVEVFEKKRAREDMAQAVWAAEQYKAAIKSYYHASPASKRMLPRKLADLLEDTRFDPPLRHLRALYLIDQRGRERLRPVFHGEGVVGVRLIGHSEEENGYGVDLLFEGWFVGIAFFICLKL